jgi:glucose-6-phosphate 1-dehydrogenase
VFSTKEVGLDVSFDAALGPRQEPYERLLEDVIEGDPRRFARADSVAEAWRVVQPVLDAPETIRLYAEGSMGPASADAMCEARGGWHDPAER